MRHQSKILKHHAHPMAANVHQAGFRHGCQIGIIQPDFAGRWSLQLGDTAQDGRFARPGQPHNDKQFTGCDVDIHIARADNGICAVNRLFNRCTRCAPGACRFGGRTEQLPQSPAANLGIGTRCLGHGAGLRLE